MVPSAVHKTRCSRVVSLLCFVFGKESNGSAAFTDILSATAQQSILGYSSTSERSCFVFCHLGVAQPPSAARGAAASHSAWTAAQAWRHCSSCATWLEGAEPRTALLGGHKGTKEMSTVPHRWPQNQWGWNRPLRLTPVYDLTPPCQLDHNTKCWVQSFLKDLQGRWLPGKPISMSDHSFLWRNC